MGTVIQHNMLSMNANRNLGITTGAQKKSTEKLSTGYKINRAADDAAGLSISEKMRRQVKGLTQASANAQDGISAVQTAEGALTEVHDMLQRMNELANKASNGTMSFDDRQNVQDEIDQLVTEINRVSETTKFNDTYLLKGDASRPKALSYSYSAGTSVAATAKFTADSATGLTVKDIKFVATSAGADQNAVAKSLRDNGITITKFDQYIDTCGDTNQKNVVGYKVSLNGDAAQKYDVIATSSKDGKFEIRNKSGDKIAAFTVDGGAGLLASATSTNKDTSVTATISASSVSAGLGTKERNCYYDKDGNAIAANALDKLFTAADGKSTSVQIRADAPTVYDAVGNRMTLSTKNVAANRDLAASLQLSLQVGVESSGNNKITLKLDAMSSKSLGLNGLKVNGSDSTNADAAINTINAAISKVSSQRSALGAIQNRLEHTIKNLDNVNENTTSAESLIRDTDMASEMVNYSKNNILAQAGQSMLAQANQSTQGVLSLLG
jgi:flagellin